MNTSIVVLILLNANFKAIRRGPFVRANEDAGEFIYRAGEPSSFTITQLEEIATANKIHLPHYKTKAQLQSTIDEALMSDKNIPEQNEISESEKAEKIVAAGFAAGKKEDDILVELVTSGISFRKAGPLFKQAVEKLGLRTSAKDLKTRIKELIEESKELETWDAVQALARAAIKDLKDVKESTAISSIKAYYKANEKQLPEKPKGARGAVGARGKAYDFISENPWATISELEKVIGDAGKDPAKYKSIFAVQKLVRKTLERFGVEKQ